MHPPAYDTSSKPFHVAILGAGIGGLALAIGLLHQKVPYTLYERSPEYAAIGAGIGLGPNALKAMRYIDPRLCDLYDTIKSGNLTPGKEHVMAEILMAEDGFGTKKNWRPRSWGSESFQRTSAHRRDLLRIMTSLIPEDTVKFNMSVTSIAQVTKDKVQLTFDNDDVVEAGAVICCDGVNGNSRLAVLGNRYSDHVEPRYSGEYAYRMIVPMKDATEILGSLASDAKKFVGPDAHVMTYPISRGEQLNVVAFKSCPEWQNENSTQEVTREEMIADFKPLFDERLIKLLKWAKPSRWPLFHHDETPIYHNGRICLLGDVAHATTPHQAAGAGQCFEDAYILSHLLGAIERPEHMDAAIQAFDAVRRPRAQRVVLSSFELGDIYSFRNLDIGDDMVKMAENLDKRFDWLWNHDLQQDLYEAKAMMAMAVKDEGNKDSNLIDG